MPDSEPVADPVPRVPPQSHDGPVGTDGSGTITHGPKPTVAETTEAVKPALSSNGDSALNASHAPFGYDIVSELGRGGMGVVYKARQCGANRTVALKMILGGAAASPTHLQRFAAEAELAAKVQHPHVAQLYDVRTHAGLPFLVFEFVDGPPLSARLREAALPPADAARIVSAVAGAVEAAHAKGVVHRDLKPGNILIAADGSPKVVDFGIARDLESDATPTGAVIGTPNYMAPEQAEGDARRIGPRTDVYALGAVLYECLTGRPPFKAATLSATLSQVVGVEPVPLRRLNPAVPRDLETVCLKCLQKSPDRRYPSASDLADDLDRFLTGRPILARPVGPVERGVKWARRKPALAGMFAAVVAAVLIAAVGVLAAWRQTDRAYRLERDHVEAIARERDKLERQLYLFRVAQADRERATGKPAWAREQLDLCPPALRRWEWFVLDRLCRGGGPRVVKAHTRGVSGVAFHPAGAWVASSSGDGTVRLWNPATGDPVGRFDGPGGSLNAVAVSPDGGTVVAGTESGLVTAWGAASKTVAWDIDTGFGPVLGVAFGPDGRRVAVAATADHRPGGVGVWDTATRRPVHRRDGLATAVAFVRQTGQLLAAGYDGRVSVIDPDTGRDVLTFREHTQPVSFLTVSPDGVLLASASGRPGPDSPDDGTLIWDRATGVVRHRLRGHAKRVMAAAFLPDGQRLVTAGWDGSLKVWDVETGQEIVTLAGHGGGVLALAAGSDGRVVSGGMDGELLIWDGRPADVP